MRKIKLLLLSLLLIGACALAQADDFSQIQIGIGYGPQVFNQSKNQYNSSLDLIYNFYRSPIDKSERWNITFGTGYTYLKTNLDVNEHLHVFSFIPSLQYSLRSRDSWQPYFRLGIGPSYMSTFKLGRQTQGNNWVFNNYIGFGFNFGKKQEWEFNWYWRHLSNAGLNLPNPGIDVPFSFHFARQF